MWLSTPHDDTKLFPHILKYSLFVSGSNPFLWRALYYIFVSLHVFSTINCFLLLPGNASSHWGPLSGTIQQTTHTIQLAHQSAYRCPLRAGEDGLTRTELNWTLENQPIKAKLSKIALYWHSWFNLNSYILANEIAWLQIIGKWHTDVSGYTRGILQVSKTLVSIPLLSCSAVQCYFSRSTERKILSHAQEWKLNRFFSSAFYSEAEMKGITRKEEVCTFSLVRSKQFHWLNQF